MLDSSDKDLDELISYIANTVQNMVKNKQIHMPDGVSAGQITRRLVRILRNSLNSDGEQVLVNLLQKIEKIQSDKDLLEREFRTLQSANRRQAQRIGVETEELRAKCRTLESKLARAKQRRSEKEVQGRKLVNERSETITNLRSLIDSADSTRLFLRHQIGELQKSALKMHHRQVKMLEDAKETIGSRLQRTAKRMISRQKMMRDRRIARLTSDISAQKQEQKRLQAICDNVLAAIWKITPKGEKHPDITVQDFPSRVMELRKFVEASLYDQQEQEIRILKDRIGTEFPNLDLEDDDLSVPEIVEKYVAKKVESKAAEYEELLKVGAEKEKELRIQLSKTLSSIRRLQSGSRSLHSLGDTEEDPAHWSVKRDAVDKSLRALARDRQCYSPLISGSPERLSLDGT
jgi:hypothetical protein